MNQPPEGDVKSLAHLSLQLCGVSINKSIFLFSFLFFSLIQSENTTSFNRLCHLLYNFTKRFYNTYYKITLYQSSFWKITLIFWAVNLILAHSFLSSDVEKNCEETICIIIGLIYITLYSQILTYTYTYIFT